MKIMVISIPDLIVPDVSEHLQRQAKELGIECEIILENSEGGLVTAVQKGFETDGVILNAGDYARYSIAIRDAISSIKKTPVVEVHLTNTPPKMGSCHSSVLSAVCAGVIAGFGQDGYSLAFRALSFEKQKSDF